MRQDKIRQVICISENNAADFEERMNESLRHLSDPEIKLYDNSPYTAVILYKVTRNIPEDILELFELVEGQRHNCIECPHFVKSDDKRKKWGSCALNAQPTRMDSRACEDYYLFRYKVLSEASKKYAELPFTVE